MPAKQGHEAEAAGGREEGCVCSSMEHTGLLRPGAVLCWPGGFVLGPVLTLPPSGQLRGVVGRSQAGGVRARSGTASSSRQ